MKNWLVITALPTFYILERDKIQTFEIISLFLVVGVCLMVGILFFMMIAIETAYDWIFSKIKTVVGAKKTTDPEDPASLVGSFKRYKN